MRKLLPVIIMLLFIPLAVGMVYAEAESHVDVYDYPFNITLLEGGNFTLYNNGTNNIQFNGSFSGTVNVDSEQTFELPVYFFNAPNTYYLRDVTLPDTYMSTVTLVKPQVNFGSTSSETVGTFEPISNSTFVEPTIVPVTPATPEEDDIITSSSVSIPTSNTVYIDQTPVNNEEGYVKDGRVYDSKGFDITVDKINLVDPVEEVVQGTESTSDTEVLNLRLEILKVIESIFRLVLQ